MKGRQSMILAVIQLDCGRAMARALEIRRVLQPGY